MQFAAANQVINPAC